MKSIVYCLGEANDPIDYVYEKPLLKLGRLLSTFAAYAPRGHEAFLLASEIWLGRKTNHRRILKDALAHLVPATPWELGS